MRTQVGDLTVGLGTEIGRVIAGRSARNQCPCGHQRKEGQCVECSHFASIGMVSGRIEDKELGQPD